MEESFDQMVDRVFGGNTPKKLPVKKTVEKLIVPPKITAKLHSISTSTDLVGEHAKDIQVDLSFSPVGDLRIVNKSLSDNRNNKETVFFTAGSLERIFLEANGGDGRRGQDGVNGHDGRDGEDGYNGYSASHSLPGSNGNSGTNGIDGTDGTNGTAGTDGGDGGDINIKVHEQDVDVLFLVHATSNGGAGGAGGTGGRGGRGGDGGDGGSGGAACSWSEPVERTRTVTKQVWVSAYSPESYTHPHIKSCGGGYVPKQVQEKYTDYEQRYKSGGYDGYDGEDGDDGRDGFDGATGQDGIDGRITCTIVSDDKKVISTTNADIALSCTEISFGDKKGALYPGTQCSVTIKKLKNTGSVPFPAGFKFKFNLYSDGKLVASTGEWSLRSRLAPSQEVGINAELKTVIPFNPKEIHPTSLSVGLYACRIGREVATIASETVHPSVPKVTLEPTAFNAHLPEGMKYATQLKWDPAQQQLIDSISSSGLAEFFCKYRVTGRLTGTTINPSMKGVTQRPTKVGEYNETILPEHSFSSGAVSFDLIAGNPVPGGNYNKLNFDVQLGLRSKTEPENAVILSTTTASSHITPAYIVTEGAQVLIVRNKDVALPLAEKCLDTLAAQKVVFAVWDKNSYGEYPQPQKQATPSLPRWEKKPWVELKALYNPDRSVSTQIAAVVHGVVEKQAVYLHCRDIAGACNIISGLLRPVEETIGAIKKRNGDDVAASLNDLNVLKTRMVIDAKNVESNSAGFTDWKEAFPTAAKLMQADWTYLLQTSPKTAEKLLQIITKQFSEYQPNLFDHCGWRKLSTVRVSFKKDMEQFFSRLKIKSANGEAATLSSFIMNAGQTNLLTNDFFDICLQKPKG